MSDIGDCWRLSNLCYCNGDQSKNLRREEFLCLNRSSPVLLFGVSERFALLTAERAASARGTHFIASRNKMHFRGNVHFAVGLRTVRRFFRANSAKHISREEIIVNCGDDYVFR